MLLFAYWCCQCPPQLSCLPCPQPRNNRKYPSNPTTIAVVDISHRCRSAAAKGRVLLRHCRRRLNASVGPVVFPRVTPSGRAHRETGKLQIVLVDWWELEGLVAVAVACLEAGGRLFLLACCSSRSKFDHGMISALVVGRQESECHECCFNYG